MKFTKIIPFFAIIFLLIITGFLSNALAQTLTVEQTNLTKKAFGDSFEGFWQLNFDESDDSIKIIQTLIQNSDNYNEKEINAEQSNMPEISISIIPPESLVLVGNENEMTINEFYTDHISTRTRLTDGIPDIYQAENNVNIAVSAERNEIRLLIQTLSPRGNRMLETYELFDHGNKLKVTIQISDLDNKELLTLHRTYDRAIIDNPSDYY